MDELSPAAQAVMDAAEPCVAPNECPGLEAAIAAALRAAADQVVPEEEERAFSQEDSLLRLQRCATRHKLLAIAAELEGSK
jgi:hypothetical protein